jgi:hypothetical protein
MPRPLCIVSQTRMLLPSLPRAVAGGSRRGTSSTSPTTRPSSPSRGYTWRTS